MDVVGQESGQGVSLPPAWLAVPWPLHTKDRCCYLSLGVGDGQGLLGTGTELWLRKDLGITESIGGSSRVPSGPELNTGVHCGGFP